jgi:hypothetical protein
MLGNLYDQEEYIEYVDTLQPLTPTTNEMRNPDIDDDHSTESMGLETMGMDTKHFFLDAIPEDDKSRLGSNDITVRKTMKTKDFAKLTEDFPIILVDTEVGPIKRITDAINKAEPGTHIRIAPGLYSENLVIRKPGLVFEPKEKSGDIIFIVPNSPTILIELEPDEICTFIGIKMSHQGKNAESSPPNTSLLLESKKHMSAKKYDMFRTQDHYDRTSKSGLISTSPEKSTVIEMSPEDPFKELPSSFEISTDMNCILYLKSGNVKIEDCFLSLSVIF